jgi:mRNA interferase MazF
MERDGVSKPAPWQVWYADLDPTEGREQAGRRPVLVVSSAFHLNLTGSALLTVLPVTSVERPGWLHRVAIDVQGRTSYVITEQVRTVARARLGDKPVKRLDTDEIAAVREVLASMLAV